MTGPDQRMRFERERYLNGTMYNIHMNISKEYLNYIREIEVLLYFVY